MHADSPRFFEERRQLYDAYETRPLSLYTKGAGTETNYTQGIKFVITSVILSVSVTSLFFINSDLIFDLATEKGTYMYVCKYQT